MRVLNWALDAWKTPAGKIVAVMVSLALVFSMSNVIAYAADADDANAIETTESEEKAASIDSQDSKSDDKDSVESDDKESATEDSEDTEESDDAEESDDQGEESAAKFSLDEDTAVNYNAGSDEEGTEGDTEEEAEAEPITFDEETKTLTIKGKFDLTKESVKDYKTKAQYVTVDIEGSIENDVFREWNALKELTIKCTGSIGGYAVWNTTVEKIVVEKADSIALYAFGYNSSLTEVSISKVDKVEGDLFNVNTNNLATVTLKNVKEVGNTFQSRKSIKSLTLENIDYVAKDAFASCENIESVDLSSVKELGQSAFSYCNALENVVLDNIKLGATTFFSCKGLKTVEIRNLETLPQTFSGCSSLEEVKIENVETIEEQAFVALSSLKTVEITKVGVIGKNAFASCKALANATLTNVDTIGQYAFYNCTGLKNVTLSGKTQTIENYAFWNCAKLESINSLSNVSGSIGGFAFYGCKNLKGLTVADAVKMGYIGSNDDIMERVEAILSGKFQLDDASEIKQIQPSDWTATAKGENNWDSYDNGTQITQAARWADAENGEAEIEVKAYYAAQKQMDYVFVADLSASMAQLGNAADSNARFYDMQSKLLDMTSKLLNTAGYDCRVSIVTFGGNHQGNATVKVLDFTNDSVKVHDHIYGLEPLNENTDYALGLNKALQVVQGQKTDRDTVVVFLSDGRPTYDGETQLKTVAQLKENDEKVANIAKQIKDAGAKGIYGVLHSPGTAGVEYAQNAMNAVCDQYFESNSTESFGNAMNAAFTSVYGNNTVTVKVNNTEFDVESINVTAGEYAYDAETGIITWTLQGMPFTEHKLTYTLKLKDDLAGRVGTYEYSINNNGNAEFNNNGAAAGINLKLSRTVNEQVQTPPSTEVEMGSYRVLHAYYTNGELDGTRVVTKKAEVGTQVKASSIAAKTKYKGNTYTRAASKASLTVAKGKVDTLTIQYNRTVEAAAPAGGNPGGAAPVDQGAPVAAAAPVAAPVVDDGAGDAVIPDDENPLAQPEDDAANEGAEVQEMNIADDENPMGAFDAPECPMHIFIIIGMILTLIYGAGVITNRLRLTNQIDGRSTSRSQREKQAYMQKRERYMNA